MKKAVLFLNGKPPQRSEIDAVFADPSVVLVFCTDGAYSYLLPHLPDTVVGDFDSVSRSRIRSGVEIISFGVEKDYTDGYLAMKILLERGYTDIDVYGAYGGRPDMQESNYTLLALALKKGARARFCGKQTAFLCNDSLSCTLKKGARFSLVPFTDTVHIVYTKGLKYALTDYTMHKFDDVDSPDYVMGVSNEATGTEDVQVAVSEGIALVFAETE
ncbi:MAG: thiamine diphosphokinase [Clostridiales bacterium]|nr:thiamine diphosphokinase [Clostridiales bacterium]